MELVCTIGKGKSPCWWKGSRCFTLLPPFLARSGSVVRRADGMVHMFKNQMWQWGAVVVLCSSNLIDIIMMHCFIVLFFLKKRPEYIYFIMSFYFEIK